MSSLTRDGTAEPVSRDQILRHARGQGNIYFPCSADHEQDATKFSGTHGDRGIFIFPVQLTPSRIGNLTRLIHTLLYVMTVHTYIRGTGRLNPSRETEFSGTHGDRGIFISPVQLTTSRTRPNSQARTGTGKYSFSLFS